MSAPRWFRGLSAAALAGILGACAAPEAPTWEYMPDMAHSVAYDAFAPNGVTRDGKTLIAPAAGTVPRGHLPLLYGPSREEAERAGRTLENPLEPSAENLERGAVLYQTFCQACHGPTGQGDGPVAGKIPPPPAYSSPALRDLPPGQLFHILTHGSNRMPSYAAQLRPEDRWRVIFYVQRLQQEGAS